MVRDVSKYTPKFFTNDATEKKLFLPTWNVIPHKELQGTSIQIAVYQT